ncbi:MAG: hypothetical protein ABL993_15290 [Vicinamibacterales bacterium]
MNNVWIVIGVGIGIVGVIAGCVTFWFRRGAEPDMGTVSTQWVSEQRADGRDGHR